MNFIVVTAHLFWHFIASNIFIAYTPFLDAILETMSVLIRSGVDLAIRSAFIIEL